ncbi:unnamed protein product [Lota lota]
MRYREAGPVLTPVNLLGSWTVESPRTPPLDDLDQSASSAVTLAVPDRATSRLQHLTSQWPCGTLSRMTDDLEANGNS